MAKNTTATGSTIDGVTVVHPDNMGMRLEYNDQTKKYDVNVDDLLDEIKKLKESQYIDTTPSIDTPHTYFNLDTDLTGLGMKVFYGDIIVVNNPETAGGWFLDVIVKGSSIQNGSGKSIPVPTFVKGAPKKQIDTVDSGTFVEAGYELSDFEGNQGYDFTGYQFGTPVEIVQVLFHQSQTYTRTNDSGMRLDGSIVDTNAWRPWLKS